MKLIFRTFFRTLRLVLGPFMRIWELVSTPKGIVRMDNEQKIIDTKTQHLKLYQFQSCPFCIKVRRVIKRLSLNIEIFDTQKDPSHREDLLKGGGEIKVPCLRINDDNGNTTWLYESSDIIRYLNDNFGGESAAKFDSMESNRI